MKPTALALKKTEIMAAVKKYDDGKLTLASVEEIVLHELGEAYDLGFSDGAIESEADIDDDEDDIYEVEFEEDDEDDDVI